jgi:hypothetical protein
VVDGEDEGDRLPELDLAVALDGREIPPADGGAGIPP